MNDDPIPVAVVGAGNMGANHIRVYDELSNANLVEIVEPDPERSDELNEGNEVSILDGVDEIEKAQAASIAVPNHLHKKIAEQCIREGLDILVEKPLAMTVEDAEQIVETADKHDAVLQVGHIERFNPAVETLGEILKSEEIIAVEAHRLGPFNEHLNEETVIFDLMIHDLDVVDSLVSDPVTYMDAIGTKSQSEALDHTVACLKFEETLATITASHVTHGKVRTLDVTTKDGYIRLNYQEQNIKIQRRGMEQTTTLQTQSGYRTETVTETPYISTEEPLKNELRHFVERVIDRKEPRVDGRDGVNAVRLGTEIIDHIRFH